MTVELQSTTLATQPYNDDFNEDKNFHRILFKPGVAVQARELTQVQTYLQSQVERGADYIFKNGAIVTGCPITLTNIPYVKLQDRDSDNTIVPISNFANNVIIRGLSSNVFATVINQLDGAEASDPNYKTLYLRYGAGGSNTDQTYLKFDDNESIHVVPTTTLANSANSSETSITVANAASFPSTGTIIIGGENITYTTVSNNTISGLTRGVNSTVASNLEASDLVLIISNTSTNATSLSANATGANSSGGTARALILSVGDGIMYGKGNYVKVYPHTLIVSRYGPLASVTANIGFNIAESIITSDADTSLLDSAESTNQNAPGADRLKLIANLALQSNSTTSFTSIAQIENGNIVYVTEADQGEKTLNQLGNVLASRTFTQSGNFSVGPNEIIVKENFANATNAGYAGGDGNTFKLAVQANPGTVYVEGYYHKFLNVVTNIIDKGIDTQFGNEKNIYLNYGQSIRVSELFGTWPIDNFATVNLVNTAQQAVTVTTDGTSAFTADSSGIGTAKVRAVELRSGNIGYANAVYDMYLFDIKMNNGEDFKDVRGITYTGSSNNSAADLQLDAANNAFIDDAADKKLLFPTGVYATKNLVTSETSFVTRKKQEVNLEVDGSTTFNITTATGGVESFNETGTITTDNKVVIIPKVSAYSANGTGTLTTTSGSPNASAGGFTPSSVYSVGDLVEVGTTPGGGEVYQVASANATHVIFSQNAASSLSANTHRLYFQAGIPVPMTTHGREISATSSAMTIDMGTYDGSTMVLEPGQMASDIIFNVFRAEAVQKAKLIHKNEFVLLEGVSGNTGPFSLGIIDVVKVRNVYNGSNTSAPNVTDKFDLDNGQKDGFYDHARLKLKRNISFRPAANNLLVELDYFTVDSSQGAGFFSINSYPIDDANTANTSAITTAEIPHFTSPTDGEVLHLRDFIDFRPRKTNYATPSANSAAAPTIDVTDVAANATAQAYAIGTAHPYTPLDGSNLITDYNYYLGRVDSLFVDSDGVILVKRGIPEVNAKPPSTAADGSMLLARISIPPFPSLPQRIGNDLNRIEYSVTITKENNKGYTMKALRGLEQRIQTLEYYSVLSLLEQQANEQQLPTSAGLNRFKNGFLVDPFVNHSVGQVYNPGYTCAVDPDENILTSRFNVTHLDLIYNSSLSTAQESQTGTRNIKKGLVTVPWTETVYTQQPYASKGLLAAAELSFNWKGQVELSPPSDHWCDTERLPEITADLTDYGEVLGEVINWLGPKKGDWEKTGKKTGKTKKDTSTSVSITGNQQTTTTTTTTYTPVTTTYNKKTKKLTAEVGYQEETLGDRVVDVGIEPYMRTRAINITGSGFRPNTRVYFFFDQVDVNSNVYPAFRQVNTAYAGDFPRTNKAGVFLNRSISNRKTAYGQPVVTDDEGNFYAVFRIPKDTFLSGERALLVTNQANLETDPLTTSGSANYNSMGLNTIKQETILATAPVSTSEVTIKTETKKVSSKENVKKSVSKVTVTLPPPPADDGGGGGDPTAQTFMVEGTQGGIFVTSVDIYFKNKSPQRAIGCRVQIRTVENGFPTPFIVPYGEKRVAQRNINLSQDATVATNFSFDNPVYLQNEAEYCIVIMPDNNDTSYEVWAAELGQEEVENGYLIHQQPHVGVVLQSANDKTWTTLQNTDIKFTLNRAQFTTGTDYTATFVKEKAWFFHVTEDSVGGPIVNEKVQGTQKLTIDSSSAGNTDLIANGTLLESSSANDDIQGMVRFANSTTIVFDPYDGEEFIISSGTVNVTANGETFVINAASNTFEGTIAYYNAGERRLYVDTSAGSNITAGNITSNGGTHLRGSTSNSSFTVLETFDVPVNIVNYGISHIQPTMTTLTSTITVDNSNALFSQISEDVNIPYDNQLYVRSVPNEGTGSGGANSSFRVQFTMRTERDNISPVLNKAQADVSLIENKLNISNTQLEYTSDLEGGIGAILISAGGSGYDSTVNNELVFSGGNGFFATATFANDVSGTITSVNITDSGKGYVASPTVTVNATGVNGNTAAANGAVFDAQIAARARYITKVVTLAEGQDAEDLIVYFDAYKPSYSDIYVFCKLLNAIDSEDFDDKNWTLMEQQEIDTLYSKNDNDQDFKEFSFKIPSGTSSAQAAQNAFRNTNNSEIVRYADSTGAVYDGFKQFAVKIVMNSTNNNYAPKIRNLRAIALQV